MNAARPLPAVWKDRLDLSMRDVPDLYEDPQVIGQIPHANAIRTAFEDLNASAVFCVQDVPTVVIVVFNVYDREHVISLHRALWNQGLATLLLVICGDTIRTFSLARRPHTDDQLFDDRCLVHELDAVAEGLAVKNLIYSAESGRLWEHNSFKPSERIDQVLLSNLSVSHRALCRSGLSTDAAQALLIQTMFIAYLEDRGFVTPEHIKSASVGASEEFIEILESNDSRALYRLFARLRSRFNGDLFVAPCSFDSNESPSHVTPAHLQTLSRFRKGNEEMINGGGQLRFWGYDFRYIPIELISAVYDHFLGVRESGLQDPRRSERRLRGAYYTPMFLADTVISSVWDTLPESTKEKDWVVLDPACGSGMFLVRSFQLFCEHWRHTHRSRTIPWENLLTILYRLHGWDLDAAAVRIAVFSLYIALLQEVGTLGTLPKLWNRTLRTKDFFEASYDTLRADVIIGNPPWSSRRDTSQSAVRWCDKHQRPMPGKEIAWAFVWKSLQHLRKRGVVGLLLPAMGFLHNHGLNAVRARNQLIRDARIHRIVNFSDMRFQLFEGAVHSAALVIFGHAAAAAPGYRFDYLVPKADWNLKIRRAITLSSVDRRTISSRHAVEDASVFKRLLWMTDPESKLFGYLAALPKLGDLVNKYRDVYRRIESFDTKWVIGCGFKPANRDRLSEEDYQYQDSKMVASTPYLPIQEFRALAQACEHLHQPFASSKVHGKGFERGFIGPRVLVPRGIRTTMRRLQASFLEEPLSFQHIILSISVPEHDVNRAKLLTALLNSKLLFWFAFHGTASFGSNRPEIQQAELLRLPFPSLHDVQHDGSEAAATALVSLIDEAERAKLAFEPPEDRLFKEIDSNCYRYFGLGKEEIALVEDTVEHVIQCTQPHSGSSLYLCKEADRADRLAYATTLVHSMSQWLDSDDDAISVVIEARNEDLALLHLRLVQRSSGTQYQEHDNLTIGTALRRLHEHMEVPLPGNFQLVPDFRLFAGKSLYLVKPLQRRYWLKSAAIADADAIAMELQDAVRLWDTGNPA